MSSQVLDNGLAMLEFAREVTLGLLEDIPQDKWFFSPVPGGTHASWIVGHLA